MDPSREYNYSVLKLIEAVRVRPELWDSSRAEFRSYKNKDRVWQDVFQELDDNYRFLSEKEQSVIAMKITTKWRNIRDVFIRSIKKRATDRKMKKYMYHDRLSFMHKLYKSYIRSESPSQFDLSMSSIQERRAQRSISFDNIPENSLDENPKTSTFIEREIVSIKTEPVSSNEEEIHNYGNEECSSSKNTVTDLNEEFETISCSEMTDNQTVESEIEPLENDNHHDKKPLRLGFNQTSSERNLEGIAILQPDEDEAFLSSILPSLRDMSVDEKLEFRIAVLQKISYIRSKRQNS